MRTTPSLLLATLTGLASPGPLAHAQTNVSNTPALAPDAPMPAQLAGYVYINARTGERVVSAAPSTHRASPAVFSNTDIASNGFFFWGIDNPTLNFPTTVAPPGTRRIGAEVSDWGDIQFDTVIDGFSFAYAQMIQNGCSPDHTLPGLHVTLSWYDCDNGRADPAAMPLRGIEVLDLNAGLLFWPFCDGPGPPFALGWIYVIDLAGTELVFELGDTDGTYTGVTGQSATGCDKDDTDGNPLNDFGWSYTFDQSETGVPLGSIGPYLVLPEFAARLGEDDLSTPTGSESEFTYGVEDGLDMWYRPNGLLHEVFVQTYNFGGWNPSTAIPYASFYMELFGTLGGGINPCPPADHNNDGSIDILDFLDFIDDFNACDGLPAPCGTYGDADINGDGLVDILDFLDFFSAFSQCS